MISLAVIVVLLLVVLPWLLSPVVKSAVNRRLAALPDYRGEVGSVRIALWRLTVDIDDFVLTNRNAALNADGPLVKVGHASMTLLPGRLIRGRLAGRGEVSDIELLIVQDEPKASDQDSKEQKETKTRERMAKAQQWKQQLQERFDVEITRFEISRMKVRFIDRSMPGNPELNLGDFHLLATDLKTQPDAGRDLPAHVEISGRFGGGGTLHVNAALDPSQKQPRFQTSLEVKDLQLPPLHAFLLAYANVDVQRGSFEVFSEAQAMAGHYAGYVKPFFRDLEFKAVPDPEKGFLRNTATKVASAVTNLLKNDEQNVATKIPFEGDFANNDVDVWTALQNLLRNAFVQSLREGFEGQRPTS